MLDFYTPNKTKKIYLSSDFHGFHKNICKGSSSWSNLEGCRDFKNEIEMTECLVSKINEIVKFEDILYHLGDWSFGGMGKVEKLRKMINCDTVINVLGNHDSGIRKHKHLQDLFSHVSSYEEFFYDKKLICCSHYAFGVWNGIGKYAINCFGHSHNSYERISGRQMDVGVDTNNLYPYSVDEIIDRMNKTDIVLVDHHDAHSNLR